jgi:hypothetical protein
MSELGVQLRPSQSSQADIGLDRSGGHAELGLRFLGSHRLATDALESWYRNRVDVDVIWTVERSLEEPVPYRPSSPVDLPRLLGLPRDEIVWHREVRMTVRGLSVGRAFSTVASNRLTDSERARLQCAGASLGTTLHENGVRRQNLEFASDETASEVEGSSVVRTCAVLFRGETALAYVCETFHLRQSAFD